MPDWLDFRNSLRKNAKKLSAVAQSKPIASKTRPSPEPRPRTRLQSPASPYALPKISAIVSSLPVGVIVFWIEIRM
jgi:hypothetical protein